MASIIKISRHRQITAEERIITKVQLYVLVLNREYLQPRKLHVSRSEMSFLAMH